MQISPRVENSTASYCALYKLQAQITTLKRSFPLPSLARFSTLLNFSLVLEPGHCLVSSKRFGRQYYSKLMIFQALNIAVILLGEKITMKC